MANLVKVAQVSEIEPGQSKVVEVQGQAIALFNVDGTFYAIGNTCCHRGGPLGEGHLEGTKVTCPWHAWRFDVTTGVSELTEDAKVPSFPVELKGEEIHVEIPAS